MTKGDKIFFSIVFIVLPMVLISIMIYNQVKLPETKELPSDPNCTAVWDYESNEPQYTPEYFDELYKDYPGMSELVKELYNFTEPRMLRNIVKKWDDKHIEPIQEVSCKE
jgi:hypothetical protein